jgi:hypothetical protein
MMAVRKAYEVLVRKSEREKLLFRVGIDEKIILGWI